MKIQCIHGYFKFEEREVGQMSDFISLFGLEIERSGDHFTFSDLIDAPKHSLPGGLFLGCPTTVAFEGEPWEVMRENEIVYDFSTGLVVPIATIIQTFQLQTAGNKFLSSGMILPGSVMEDGTRVRDYAAFFKNNRFEYSEVAGE
jgi:hypothetical protein